MSERLTRTRRRRETPGDAAFLRALFAADAREPLRRAGLAEEAVALLVALQFRSRDASYRALHPGARFDVIECFGTPVGRFVEADEGSFAHVVDIAVIPAWRRRGIGAAVLRDAMARWAASGRGGHADIVVGNGPSLALFAALGFTGTSADGAAQVRMTWQP